MKFSQTEMEAMVSAENQALTRNEKRGLVAVGLAGLVEASHAAVDVSSITGAGTDIALVGGAVFAVYIGIKLYKWIRGAL